MSVHAHLNLDRDEMDLFLTNEQIENQLSESQLSSASNWTVALDDNIDFADLTYMKGTSCEIGVAKFWIDAFPLTFTHDESIEIHITMPEEIGIINQLFSKNIIRTKFNKQAYLIPLENFSATESELAVDFLTQRMSSPIAHFLLRASLKVVLDTDIFTSNHLGPMSLEDIHIVNRYIDIALFSRQQIHKHLQGKLPEKDDIDNLITFQERDFYTQAKETKVISTSHTLRPADERPKSRDSNSMNLSWFYNVDLSKADTTNPEGPKAAIIMETEQFLTELNVEVRVESNDPNIPPALTSESKKKIQDLISANKALIHQALKARKILGILREKADKRKKPSSKDAPDLFQIVLDPVSGKIHCVTNPEHYLCNDGTQVIVKLPPKCSYKMGAKAGDSIALGPASNGTTQNDGQNISHSTHTLTHKKQSPPCCIRPFPRILHILTDLAGPLKRDLWLKNTRFEDYNIIYSVIIDDTAITNKFVSKQNEDILYYRMSNLKTSLNSIDVFLVDENFQLADFMPLCYCRLAMKVRVTTPS